MLNFFELFWNESAYRVRTEVGSMQAFYMVTPSFKATSDLAITTLVDGDDVGRD